MSEDQKALQEKLRQFKEALSGASLVWAHFGEDQQMNPAPDLLVDFRPSGAAAGPGSPGNGPGSKNDAGCRPNEARRPNLRPILG